MFGWSTISVRRLPCRPAGVSLGAMGSTCPYPAAESDSAGTPASIKKCTTTVRVLVGRSVCGTWRANAACSASGNDGCRVWLIRNAHSPCPARPAYQLQRRSSAAPKSPPSRSPVESRPGRLASTAPALRALVGRSCRGNVEVPICREPARSVPTLPRLGQTRAHCSPGARGQPAPPHSRRGGARGVPQSPHANALSSSRRPPANDRGCRIVASVGEATQRENAAV